MVIPQNFTEINHLSMGTVLEIDNIVYHFLSEGEVDVIIGQRRLEVEVITIISRDADDVKEDSDYFYMPIGLAEDMLNFDTKTKLD